MSTGPKRQIVGNKKSTLFWRTSLFNPAHLLMVLICAPEPHLWYSPPQTRPAINIYPSKNSQLDCWTFVYIHKLVLQSKSNQIKNAIKVQLQPSKKAQLDCQTFVYIRKLIMQSTSNQLKTLNLIAEQHVFTSVRSPSPLTSSLANILSALITASSREKSFCQRSNLFLLFDVTTVNLSDTLCILFNKTYCHRLVPGKGNSCL